MKYVLLLGGNLGDVDNTMRQACDAILKLGSALRRSAIYESAPWGFEAPEPFHNMAVEILSPYAPEDLLAHLKQIEIDLGRTHKTRPGETYASRNIDIDILTCDDRVVNTADLQIPHPRLQLRGFALAPMMELCPEWRHPILGLTVCQMAQHLPEGETLAKRLE